MDRVNLQTAHEHPELLRLQQCKGRGIRVGTLMLASTGAVSYLSLQLPTVGRLLAALRVHRRHQLLLAGGISLVSSYLSAAMVTRACTGDLQLYQRAPTR